MATVYLLPRGAFPGFIPSTLHDGRRRTRGLEGRSYRITPTVANTRHRRTLRQHSARALPSQTRHMYVYTLHAPAEKSVAADDKLHGFTIFALWLSFLHAIGIDLHPLLARFDTCLDAVVVSPPHTVRTRLNFYAPRAPLRVRAKTRCGRAVRPGGLT